MFKKLLKSSCFHTLVIICVAAGLIFTIIKRADKRQEQIAQLANLGKNTAPTTTQVASSTNSNTRLALTGNLGGTLLAALLNNSEFTVNTIDNEANIINSLQVGDCDFAVLELSQIVKMAALGANIQAFFPCYSESKSYGLVSKAGTNGPCRSLAYVAGTPSEYYSLFLYNSPASILSSDFKHIPVASAEKAIKLVQSGEVDGVLLNSEDKLPSGLKFISKFKPQVFHYMLVRRQHFTGYTASVPLDSAQNRLDKASIELVKLLFSLQARIQDQGKYGLLTSNLRRSNPSALASLNRKINNGTLKYIGANSDISQYQELIAEILMDWKQSPEYSFPIKQLSDETIRNRAFSVDFALSCRNALPGVGASAVPGLSEATSNDNSSKVEQEPSDSTSQPSTESEEPSSPDETAPQEKLPSPSPASTTSPAIKADANGPVSDKEIFKEEIEQGLLPETPSVLPAAPKTPPLPQQNP